MFHSYRLPKVVPEDMVAHSGWSVNEEKRRPDIRNHFFSKPLVWPILAFALIHAAGTLRLESQLFADCRLALNNTQPHHPFVSILRFSPSDNTFAQLSQSTFSTLA